MPWYKRWWLGLAHHLQVWRSAWQEQNRQPPAVPSRGRELEFLPAVLEIQETPPSPLGRIITGSIVLLFVMAIIWASFGKIDIVAVAQGKIIPSDHTKIIQPLESGVVSAIYVREGQSVQQGEVLLQLDNTVSSAEIARLQNESIAALLEAARLQALIDEQDKLTAPAEAEPEEVALQQQMLQGQRAEQQARLASAQLAIQQREAALEMSRERVRHLAETLPLLKERAAAAKKMLDRHYVTRMSYLEIEQERLEKSQQLAAQKQQQVQDQAALAEARQHYQATRAELQRTWRAELARAETRARSLQEELVKARTRTGQQRLVAPITGVVQQLAVHTIGGVVTPAQQLMVIVPREGNLEVEAWVENKDIGFVDPEQPAEIKVEAFPFTKYGVIDGKILHLSRDAVPLDNVGYVYNARVSMARSSIQVGNKHVHLTPGMNVSVEVRTGQRRVIEYFLSPLLRGFSETARER